jgi:RHS repeat-associated protein
MVALADKFACEEDTSENCTTQNFRRPQNAYGDFFVQAKNRGPARKNRVLSSKYLDDSTGWYYYGYRYYSPELGRWANRDPIGEGGGLNVYGFAVNRVLNAIDPVGLYTLVDDGGTWLVSQWNDVQDAFDDLELEMPTMMSDVDSLLGKAEDLPLDCAYRDELIDELTHLADMLEDIYDGLCSTANIKLRQVSGESYMASYTYSWFGFIEWIEFNTGPSDDFFSAPDVGFSGVPGKMDTVFHELTHMVGDATDDNDDGWTKNAYNIEVLLTSPDTWWVDLRTWLIGPSGLGLGKACCPSGDEKWPNNP